MKKYICLMASKGGPGKSTICKQLATELRRIGKKVAMADYDPQQHLARFAEANPGTFKNEELADFVIIDTQGAHTETNVELIKFMSTESGVIIVPFRPTDDDFAEALTMRDRLEELNALDKAVFVINQAYRNNDKDALEYLQMMSSTVRTAKTVLVSRKAYSKIADSKVRSEISSLINEILL